MTAEDQNGAPDLNGLRARYGDKILVCKECGEAIEVEEIIDAIEEQEVETIFTPKKISDLAFARCDECGRLRLHKMKDSPIFSEGNDNSEPGDSGHQNQDSDVSGQSEPEQSEASDDNSSEEAGSTGSSKPFSI